ncbi:MAG: ubiquinol-cytochrome c reductase iron-sulfur subunit [Acidimicrobiia bacterium]|jgi:cytochrome b6-f complex iron-sulfur subunit|nr:MAG: ubiquinol-cytochrome c reductase iron-sulfur subunit [Acidimicrobiia bacterium]
MTDLLPIALAAVAVLAAAAAFTIAWRRSNDPDWRANVQAKAAAADTPSEVPVTITAAAADGEEDAGSVAVLVDEEETPEEEPPAPVEYRAATEEEMGMTRRSFLNRALASMFGLFLAGFGMASLAFLWPKVKGGFGSDIDAGDADEILAQVLNPDGTVNPMFLPEARAYIVPMLEDSVSGSQFEGNATVDASLVALFQTCVHLGCRVPWCAPSQGFECPCHGSKYNSVGEYIAGPAPRNLDRFVVGVNDRNRFIISTGSIIATSRAIRKSVRYPQGPSCI